MLFIVSKLKKVFDFTPVSIFAVIICHIYFLAIKSRKTYWCKSSMAQIKIPRFIATFESNKRNRVKIFTRRKRVDAISSKTANRN